MVTDSGVVLERDDHIRQLRSTPSCNPRFAHRTRKPGAPSTLVWTIAGGERGAEDVLKSRLTRGPLTAFGFRLTSLKMTLFLMYFLCGVCFSQDGHAEAARADRVALRRGTNEFGGWIGYSPFSFVLKGTSKDRELLLVNLQYARTLFVAGPLTFKYAADVVPLALEFQPTQV